MSTALPTSVPIKGSWEDLLRQADTLADREDDACIAAWQKIIERLDAMPAARLDAGEGHLRQIRLSAADSMQLYLEVRGRYDEALALLERLVLTLDPQNADHWNQRIMDVLRHCGRIDALLARARTIAERAALDDIETWGDCVTQALNVKRFDVANMALGEIERRINRARKEQGANLVKEDSGYLAWLRAQLALEQHLWDEAASWFQYANTMDPLYARYVQTLYSRMIDEGGTANGLSLLQHESDPIKADFWRGLAHFRLGKAADAERSWRNVSKIDPKTLKDLPLFEWILTRYYLPDQRDIGLTMQLNAIREADTPRPLHHMLAGLGFALRTEDNNAHLHLANAQKVWQRSGLGRQLSKRLWFPFSDLLDETAREQYKQYFQLD